MLNLLKKLGLSHAISNFEREKITPDIVCKLSSKDLEKLSIRDPSDMMTSDEVTTGMFHIWRAETNYRRRRIPFTIVSPQRGNSLVMFSICESSSSSEILENSSLLKVGSHSSVNSAL